MRFGAGFTSSKHSPARVAHLTSDITSFTGTLDTARRLRIAVVNDVASQRQKELEFLLANGYAISEFSSGCKFNEISASEFPDVFLVHLIGGDTDGFSCTRRIRQRSLQSGVLLVIAADNDDYKTQAFEAGADSYLLNPYAFDELQVMLKRFFNRYSLISDGMA